MIHSKSNPNPSTPLRSRSQASPLAMPGTAGRTVGGVTSKNNSGFLLIEAMIAITVIGLLLTPILILQGTVLQNVSHMSERLHRVFFAKQFLVTTRRSVQDDAQQFTLEKKEDDPKTVLKYTLGPVDKKSSLATIPGLLFERVDIQGSQRSRGKIKAADTIVTFMFKPEQKKK